MVNTLCTLAVTSMLPTVAFAQSLHQEANGGRLEVQLSCAASVTISGNAALHDHVVLDATARNQPELDQLAFLEAPRIRLRLKNAESGVDACWRPAGATAFTPTLAVILTVPENFRLAVESDGSGIFRISVGGPLLLQFSGSVSAEIADATDINLNMAGSGKVSLQQLTGRMHAELSGSGDVSIGRVESPELAIDQSGSASLSVRSGSIDALSIQSSGSGDIEIGATVTNVVVDSAGSGEVRISRVTGQLVKNTVGSGGVRIGR